MPFTKAELEERRGYIGASEAAAVCGLSRWRTPLQVWAEKTGQIPAEEESENIPAEVGNELEDYVARLFTRRTGKNVERFPKAVINIKYPFLRAHLDRVLTDENAILQCKTCSAWKAKEWEGEEIPQEYIIQEYHEMACTNHERAYVAVLIGNSDFKFKEIPRDQKAIDAITKREVDFWNNFVQTKIMPMAKAGDSEVLQALFGEPSPEEDKELSDEVNALIEQLQALDQDSKTTGAQILAIKNQLKAHLGEAQGGRTGLYRVTWKLMHKASYTVPEQSSRVLRYRTLKEEGTNG